MIILTRLTKQGDEFRFATKSIDEVSENRDGTCWIRYTASDGEIWSGLVLTPFDDIIAQWNEVKND